MREQGDDRLMLGMKHLFTFCEVSLVTSLSIAELWGPLLLLDGSLQSLVLASVIIEAF